MGPLVQRGDVFRLDIPGDNGVTKRRVCVVLDLAPPGKPLVAIVIFGCSETKARTSPTAVVRIEDEQRTVFNALKLTNATSFHRDDIRVYEAASPMLAPGRRIGRCPAATMIELRRLLAERYRDAAPIPVLPTQAGAAVRALAMTLTARRATDGEGSGEL